jgi:subtilisin family serine protease
MAAMSSGGRGEEARSGVSPSVAAIAVPHKSSSAVDGKLSPAIQAVRHRVAKAVSPARLSNRLVRVNDAGEVQVYVRARNGLKAALAQMVSCGLRLEVVNAKMNLVQGWIALDAIEKLAGQPSVVSVTPPSYPRLRAGSVMTEGDQILGADVVRQFGVDGTGIKVGVLSNGVDNRIVAQASGDLPNVFEIDPDHPGSGDAGTALLEIIHDIAPGADLAFSGPRTSLEFIDALGYLVNTLHCQVVVDDIGFYEEPYFEDGPVALAVAGVVSQVVWVSACGDDARGHYQAVYEDINPGASGGANDFHAFAPGDPAMRIRIEPATQVSIFLQWADPFNASGNDYDLLLYNDAMTTVIAASQAVQNGDDAPLEALTFTNDTPGPMRANVVIARESGDTRTLELFILDAAQQEYVTSSDSIFGHPAVPGVLSVGAINASEPGHDAIAPYSSLGLSTIMFPMLGQRNTPRVVAVDGVSVSGAGAFPTPFYGTSAAAAHVGGIAALLWSSTLSFTPLDLRSRIESTTTDLGIAGFDIVFGFGRINADKAIPTLRATHWYLLP